MEKFTPPKTLEEFKKRANGSTVPGVQAVTQALEKQRASKVKALDEEIKSLGEIEAYLTDGTVPERFQ